VSAPELPACLSGAGILGHTWIVTITRDGHAERVVLETSSARSAVREYDAENDLSNKPAIYVRDDKSWRRVYRFSKWVQDAWMQDAQVSK
jgi:hypothetical protein